MNDGAVKMGSAADNFANAGNVVSGVMQQAETVSNRLSSSTDSLAQASKTLDSQLVQYAMTRDALTIMVSDMNTMLERAKQEAGMNRDIVQNMQKTVEGFEKLNNEANQSFDEIAKQLAETLVKFRDAMTRHDAEFHQHHADTLHQVASAYEPLAASIAGLTEMVARTRNN